MSNEEKYYLCLKEYYESKDFRKEFCIEIKEFKFKRNENNNDNFKINNNQIHFTNNNFKDTIIYNNKEYYIIDNKNNRIYIEKDNKENCYKYINPCNPCFWHIKQQKYFNNKYIEKTFITNNKKRRADILINNIQIEYQHSNIKTDSIIKRTNDYLNKQKLVLWVLDYTTLTDEFILLNDNIIRIDPNYSLIRPFTCLKKLNNAYLLINCYNKFFYISKENLKIIQENNNYIELNDVICCDENKFYNLLTNKNTSKNICETLINDFNNSIQNIFKDQFEQQFLNKIYLYQKCAGSGKSYDALHLLDFNKDYQRYYNKNNFIFLTKIKSNRSDFCNKFFDYYRNNEFKNSFTIKNLKIKKECYKYDDYKNNINEFNKLIEDSKNEQNAIIVECIKNNEYKSPLYITFGTIDSFNYALSNYIENFKKPNTFYFKNLLNSFDKIKDNVNICFKHKTINDKTLIIIDETQDLILEYKALFDILNNPNNKQRLDFHIIGDNLQQLYSNNSTFTNLMLDNSNNIYKFEDFESKCIRFYNIELKNFINEFINNYIKIKPELINYKIQPLKKIRTDINGIVKLNEFICEDKPYNLKKDNIEITNYDYNNDEQDETKIIEQDEHNNLIHENIDLLFENYIKDLLLNKNDINLPSDILILTPFPVKAVFKTIESRFNTQIQVILNNEYYQNKIIKAYENFIRTKDYNNILIKDQIEHLRYYYDLFKNKSIDINNLNFVQRHSSSDKGGINLDNSKHKLRILSIHSSKGLTCKNVFALNINTDDIMNFCKTDNPNDLQVKSFKYVAYTRASHRLFYTENSIDIYKRNYKINIDEIIGHLKNSSDNKIKQFNKIIDNNIQNIYNNNQELFYININSDDYNYNIIRYELLHIIYDCIVNKHIEDYKKTLPWEERKQINTIFGGICKKAVDFKFKQFDISYNDQIDNNKNNDRINKEYKDYFKLCNKCRETKLNTKEIPILIKNKSDLIYLNEYNSFVNNIKEKRGNITTNFINEIYNLIIDINKNTDIKYVLRILLIFNYIYEKFSINPYCSSLNLFEYLNLLNKNNQSAEYIKFLDNFREKINNNINLIQKHIDTYKITKMYNYNTSLSKLIYNKSPKDQSIIEKCVLLDNNRKSLHNDGNNFINVYLYNDISELNFGDYYYYWNITYLLYHYINKTFYKKFENLFKNKYYIASFVGIGLNNIIYDVNLDNIIDTNNDFYKYICKYIISYVNNKLIKYIDVIFNNKETLKDLKSKDIGELYKQSKLYLTFENTNLNINDEIKDILVDNKEKSSNEIKELIQQLLLQYLENKNE